MNLSQSRIEEDGAMTPRASLIFTIQEEAERRWIILDYNDLSKTIGENIEIYSKRIDESGFDGIFSGKNLLGPSILAVKNIIANKMTGLLGSEDFNKFVQPN